MGLRKVIQQGDKTLLRISKPVTEFDARLHSLLDDLKETNNTNEGMGLAAVQVGVLRRIIIVTDISGAEDKDIEIINPETLWTSDETEEDAEGCLSVPNMWAMVERPRYAKFKAQDRNGEYFEIDAQDRFLSRAIQHEIDHLDGILFTKNCGRYLSEKEIDAIMAERDRELRKKRKSAKAASGVRRSRKW